MMRFGEVIAGQAIEDSHEYIMSRVLKLLNDGSVPLDDFPS
jgi:hypothetical protein